MSRSPLPVIFDCDNTCGLPGHDIDDGLTLFYLLGQPEINLLGVTLTHGNSHLEDVIATTTRLLEATGLQSQVPLYHGDDAARFLAESAQAYSGELRVLATGAQSNLQAANQLNNRFYTDVAGLYLMGGITEDFALHGVTVNELNFSCDADAALDVLRSPAAITLLNAHTTADAVFGRDDIARLEASPLPLCRHIETHMRPWVARIEKKFGFTGFCNWDMAAAIAITHPELFEPQTVKIAPTADSMKSGNIGLSDTGRTISMPSGIRDLAAFNDLIFEAWSRCQARFDIPAPD